MDDAVAARLAAARERLSMLEPDGPTPVLVAAAPLREVSPAVQTVMVARAMEGRAPLGSDYPRRGMWLRIVMPLTAVAVLDLCGVVLALGDGNDGLAIFALVAFVVLAALAVNGARFALRDPLRFDATQRRELTAAQTWSSSSGVTGPPRAVVAAAAEAAGRIVASPALAAPELTGHRARLDLLALLDDLDAAAARDGGDAVVDRVAGVCCYADELAALGTGGAGSRPPEVPPDALDRLSAYLDTAQRLSA